VLRFWETRFTQIKPMKRGGGRRYYRPQDVELIKGIRHMLYDQGYTIKGVQKLLRENGNHFLVAIGNGDMAAVEAISQRKQADHERDGHERFVRAQTRTRRALSERGVAAFFGAFRDGVLVADLGVVRCGSTARYQAVGTDEAHRGRGLASHLLGVAASWSADRGCDRADVAAAAAQSRPRERWRSPL
jgi:DNA-binding transcriptional MerR regulator